jgi:hypothetical protein
MKTVGLSTFKLFAPDVPALMLEQSRLDEFVNAKR